MEFWQQNRIFCIMVGLCLVALLFLWPSLFGLGPTVVSLHSTRYDRAMMEHRSLQGKVDTYFPKSGEGVPIRGAEQQVRAANRTLNSNLDEMRAWMACVPRFPFRIPEPRKGNERARYVSLAYTYMRTGHLICNEHIIHDDSDGVVWLTATRNVPIRDSFFGMPDMALPESIKSPETSIHQIGLVHELGHLAIRLNVDEIGSIVPAQPYACRLSDAEVGQAYPLTVRMRCDLPTLLAFLHALDGAHGQVIRAPKPAVEDPADAVKPILPAKPAGALAEPGPPGDAGKAPAPKEAAAPKEVAPAKAPAPAPKEVPAPRPAAEAPDDPGPAKAPAARPAAEAPAAAQKLVIELTGSPSFLSPAAIQGTLKERFTVFRRDEANPQKLTFIANAIATRVLDPGKPTFTPESVVSWRALCARLKAQGEAKQPSLGKRLWPLLSPAALLAVQDAAGGKEPDDARKAEILGSLNEIIARQPDLYRAEDFAGVTLSSEVSSLLKLDRQAMSPESLQRLNRLLLEAAYPQEIARSTIKLEAAVEPASDLFIPGNGQRPSCNIVREKDFVATRYFFVRGLKVTAAPGTISKDKDGYPTDLIPPHLDVELSVAALAFAEAQTAVPEKRPAKMEAPVINRVW